MQSRLAVSPVSLLKNKAPFEVGFEPTNDGCKPPALTTLAIRSLLLVPLTKRTVYCGEVTPLVQSGVYGQSSYAYGLLYALFVILEYRLSKGKSRKKSCEFIVKPSKFVPCFPLTYFDSAALPFGQPM